MEPVEDIKSRSKYLDIWEKVFDGKTWKVDPTDYDNVEVDIKKRERFRNLAHQYAARMGWKVTIRTSKDGSIFIKKLGDSDMISRVETRT